MREQMGRRRRVRDIYGNWVMEDEGDSTREGTDRSAETTRDEREIHLDWRDYVALSIASLETFLLPMVVFIIVIVVLAILFVHA